MSTEQPHICQEKEGKQTFTTALTYRTGMKVAQLLGETVLDLQTVVVRGDLQTPSIMRPSEGN